VKNPEASWGGRKRQKGGMGKNPGMRGAEKTGKTKKGKREGGVLKWGLNAFYDVGEECLLSLFIAAKREKKKLTVGIYGFRKWEKLVGEKIRNNGLYHGRVLCGGGPTRDMVRRSNSKQ